MANESSAPGARADERISNIVQEWFLIEPILFSMYCTHILTENTSLGVPLRTGNGKIEYNPQLISGMENNELADRLKAEALRILLKHPCQRQPFRARPEILYVASSLVLLDNMGHKAFCFELLPDEIVDAMPSGKTFEEYYGLVSLLISPKQEQEASQLAQEQREDSDNAQDSQTAQENQESSSQDSDNAQNSQTDQENQESTSQDSDNAQSSQNDQENQESSSQDSDNAQNSQNTISSHLPQWKESASLWEEDSIMSVDINLIINTVKNGSSKGWGTLPGNFIECVKASLVPPINVSNLLKGFKKTILSQRRDLTRMRPSRRYGFEQMGSKYAYDTRVLVALDVSGSVDSQMLSRMLGMVNRIFKQGIEGIDVIQFDVKIKGNPIPIRKALTQLKILGRGGGTDFQPVADFYIQHPEYGGLIYITDGMAPDVQIPKAYSHLPVTWIITDDDLIPSIERGWSRAKVKRNS